MNFLERCATCGEDLRPTKLRKFLLAPVPTRLRSGGGPFLSLLDILSIRTILLSRWLSAIHQDR